MSKIITYEDGMVYVERPGTRWGRINMQYEAIGMPQNEVMAVAIQDITPPVGVNKGSTIPFNKDWFRYLDNFHSKEESSWLWTPRMLWCNRDFVGDALGSTLENGADPEPVLECIGFPCNVVRVIGETLTHYEIWAMSTSERPSKYNPKQFNWKNYPWIFAKAQARTSDYQVQNVGNGLDVFHMNFRKPGNKHYLPKSKVSLFPELPVMVNDGVNTHLIVDYMLHGSSVYGIISNDKKIPLLLAEKPGQWEFTTNWRCSGPGVIPPV